MTPKGSVGYNNSMQTFRFEPVSRSFFRPFLILPVCAFLLTGAAINTRAQNSAPKPGAKAPTKQTPPTPTTEPRFVDTRNKFSFQPPADWTHNTTIDPPYIVFVAPGETDVNIGTYGEAVGKMTLDTLVKSNKQNAKTEQGMTIYDEKATKIAGEKAYSWRIRIKRRNFASHESRQIFCIHNNRSFVLTLTGLPTNIKKYEPAFDKIVASFRWEK